VCGGSGTTCSASYRFRMTTSGAATTSELTDPANSKHANLVAAMSQGVSGNVSVPTKDVAVALAAPTASRALLASDLLVALNVGQDAATATLLTQSIAQAVRKGWGRNNWGGEVQG